jgi:hypothetical protein
VSFEPAVAEEWLSATLNGDPTLTALVPGAAWNTQADEGTSYPLVIYQMMSGVDTAAVGAIRIWTDLVYMVKVIGETAAFLDVDVAAARIDALLHRASGTVADGTIVSCVREQTFRLSESIAGGLQYRQAGGLYRINAQSN